jgi:hypothetical protein
MIISLASKRPVKTVKGVEGAQAAAVHPSGNFAAVSLQTVLAIIDLKTERITKQLKVNRRLEKMDRWPNQPDDAVARKLSQNPEKLKRLGIKSQKELESWIKEKRLLRFETQEHVFDVGFGPDGKQLFVASNGIRVFDWEELLASEGDTPPPQLCVDAPTDDANDANSRPLANCVRFDSERNLVLSSCLAGVIQYLDLATGRSGTLLKAPGEMGIWRLELTADGKALCCHCGVRPQQMMHDNKSTQCIQIWNYPALCKAIGID